MISRVISSTTTTSRAVCPQHIDLVGDHLVGVFHHFKLSLNVVPPFVGVKSLGEHLEDAGKVLIAN